MCNNLIYSSPYILVHPCILFLIFLFYFYSILSIAHLYMQFIIIIITLFLFYFIVVYLYFYIYTCAYFIHVLFFIICVLLLFSDFWSKIS